MALRAPRKVRKHIVRSGEPVNNSEKGKMIDMSLEEAMEVLGVKRYEDALGAKNRLYEKF